VHWTLWAAAVVADALDQALDVASDQTMADLQDCLQSRSFSLPASWVLSTVKCYSHRRLITKFNCGCYGLHVDIGRFGKSSDRGAGRTQSVLCACLA